MIPIAVSVLTVFASVAPVDPADLDNDTDAWRIVVDGVMGGRSTGSVDRNDSGILEFSGDLSLENNGGFSQMRCDMSGDQFAGMHGIEITVRGDGRTYNFDVRCSNARVMAGGFQRGFVTKSGEWVTVQMPFDEFRLYSFGRRVPGAPAIVPTMIESIGITLSDKKEGPFRLDIASIRVFGDEAEPSGAAELDIVTLSRRSTLERLRGLVNADEGRTPDAAAGRICAEAMRLTELAISRGAPLFNDGHPAASAAIYEVSIEALVALGADGLGSVVVERLEKGLSDARTDPTMSTRAWTYRRALDDAYSHLARQRGT